MKQILSFGAGVQSTALLLMSCRGLLPKLDCAIFADTGWEPREVYEHLEWCVKYAAKHDIPIHVVRHSKGGIKKDTVDNLTSKDGSRFASIPFFVKNADGDLAMGRRQCTREYKIAPIEKFLRREILGLKPRQRAPKEIVMHQWIGISMDESPRAKPSRDKWKEHVFPFLDWGIASPNGKIWRRYQIINWLKENYPQIEVPRSACIGCPYHSNEEWRRIKEDKDEWDEAIRFDEAIRTDKRGKMKNQQFLHRSCKPLEFVDLRTPEDKGQGNLWDNECEGMCGM